MAHEKVISLFIEGSTSSRATLRVVFEHDGELGERMMRGTHSDVRTLARSIAGSQDLIPIWDPSWIHGSASRPPADRYERRRP